MNRKLFKKLFFVFTVMLIAASDATLAFAQATSEQDIRFFLERVGDFLIRTVGPSVLVIGVCVAGVSMAMGEDEGKRRGILAALGGALIMLSRAILDLIQRITNF